MKGTSEGEVRKILAEYDEEGIYVYQAFKPSIVAEALAEGTFGISFSMERMTWIKPSFGWMLYRSDYGTAHCQEGILKIKLCHDGFLQILQDAVPSAHHPSIHRERTEWKDALKRSNVRYQWDPDRDLRLEKLERRAIQIGIRDEMVSRYVHEWILSLEEVTALAHEIKSAVDSKSPTLPEVPQLREYHVDKDLQHSLGMV